MTTCRLLLVLVRMPLENESGLQMKLQSAADMYAMFENMKKLIQQLNNLFRCQWRKKPHSLADNYPTEVLVKQLPSTVKHRCQVRRLQAAVSTLLLALPRRGPWRRSWPSPDQAPGLQPPADFHQTTQGAGSCEQISFCLLDISKIYLV